MIEFDEVSFIGAIAGILTVVLALTLGYAFWPESAEQRNDWLRATHATAQTLANQLGGGVVSCVLDRQTRQYAWCSVVLRSSNNSVIMRCDEETCRIYTGTQSQLGEEQ